MSDGGGSSALAGALQQGKGAQGYPLLTALEKQCKSRREIEKKKKGRSWDAEGNCWHPLLVFFACSQLKHVHPGEDHLLWLHGGSGSTGSSSACRGSAGRGCWTPGLPHHPPPSLCGQWGRACAQC